MRKFTTLVLFFVVLFLALGCGRMNRDVLRIAAASNLQFVLPQIVEKFTGKTGVVCELIFASSGKLAVQIENGAPYHLFLSADFKYPSHIYDNGFAVMKPEIYAFGTLVKYSLNSKTLDFNNDQVKHIALANPKIAPYGKAAQQFLNQYLNSTEIQKKIVYAESISQVNQFVLTEAADIGLSSKSSVLALKVNNEINFEEIDSKNYKEIQQGVVVLKSTSAKEQEAMNFKNFLNTDEVKSLLIANGYRLP